MKFFERGSIILLTVLVLSELKPASAANYEMSRSCLDAVNQTQAKVRNAGVETMIHISNMSDQSGHPDKKPFAVRFTMNDSRDSRQHGLVEAVMHSHKMLLGLSNDVIQKCDGVSWVSFGVNQTDYVNNFLLVNGAVRPLTCLNNPVQGASLPWGFSYCL